MLCLAKATDGRRPRLTKAGAATHSKPMAKPPPKAPKPASRPARLAEALRANLKRRKAQARLRVEAKTSPGKPESQA